MKHNALIERPKCVRHHVYMNLRAKNHLSKEADLCGAWYDCPVYGCTCSVLIPSALLNTFVNTKAALPDCTMRTAHGMGD
ncbi:MAG: hypothetical protein HFE77_03885 [Clostridiales bacterium]|nr:hypothetical protein [Clostridiales bacterium]